MLPERGAAAATASTVGTGEAKLDDFRLTVFMLGRPGREKKTEGLQYQQVPNEPRERP